MSKVYSSNLLPSLQRGNGNSLPCFPPCKIPGCAPWCSVAVSPLPQAAAVAAEDPCPALPCPAVPCRGAPSPHTSPRSALGSSPGTLSAEPGRRQSPCPGTQPLGHSRDLLCTTALGARLQPRLHSLQPTWDTQPSGLCSVLQQGSPHPEQLLLRNKGTQSASVLI